MLDKDIMKSTITSTDDGNGNYTNPVIFADVPDIDIIRVDARLYGFDDYAPVSGVSHNEILRPCKLGNGNYVFDTLEDRDNLALESRKQLRQGSVGDYPPDITTCVLRRLHFPSTGKTYIYHTDDMKTGNGTGSCLTSASMI